MFRQIADLVLGYTTFNLHVYGSRVLVYYHPNRDLQLAEPNNHTSYINLYETNVSTGLLTVLEIRWSGQMAIAIDSTPQGFDKGTSNRAYIIVPVLFREQDVVYPHAGINPIADSFAQVKRAYIPTLHSLNILSSIIHETYPYKDVMLFWLSDTYRTKYLDE